MLRTRLKAALLATTVAAAVIAPAAAASAASTTVKDGKGDVWDNRFEATGTLAFTASGSVKNVDMVHTTITHGASSVRVKMQYRDLTKSGVVFFPDVEMRFDHGPERDAFVNTGRSWAGDHQLYKGAEDGNMPVTCSGFTHAIDYAANTVTMTIPRGCLGKPRWIEASITTQGQLYDDAGPHHYIDNGATPGHAYVTWGKRLRRG